VYEVLTTDNRVTESNRERLQDLFRRLTDLTFDHGGKFYFAKDSVMSSEDALRAYGYQVLEIVGSTTELIESALPSPSAAPRGG
jgi:hypothetical protein